MTSKILIKPIFYGVLAVLALLIFYTIILTLVSGFSFMMEQFSSYWYFIVPLAIGFGIQIGLFTYIRQMHKKMSAGMVTATGTTSTLSMISCCAHYLVNLLPILGVTGIITIISTYQIQLFWVGLVFNLAGIIYMASKASKLKIIPV